MNVLLVTSPHLDHSVYHEQRAKRFAQCFVPMGLVSLAGSVTEALGDSVHVNVADINKAINLRFLAFTGHFYEQAAEWISTYSPDVVGFMTECDSYHHTLQITKALRDRSRRPITVLGCTHASATHKETLRDFPSVDYVIRGEGERAFPSLLATLAGNHDLAQVGNLSYRDGAHIMDTPELPLVDDLDALPFPSLKLLDVWPEDVVYVEIGRGCPFRCNFCFTAPYWKRKHRIKSAERILSELRYFSSEYGRTDFNFTHDLFTVDRRWVIDFCEKLWASHLNVTFTISSRTDTIDEEQIHWLAKAGCRDIYFGVETGTDDMQKAIQKHLDLKHARNVITLAAEAGIGTTVGFIAGLPGETPDSLAGSMTEAFYYLRSERATVHMFGFSPYRGSSNFDTIMPLLVFDDHFLDFPFPEEVLLANCSLMQSFPEIFSRYSRVASNSLELDIVRAAEEFFPIINALRRCMLRLAADGIDMFDTLCRWAFWIKETNLERKTLKCRSHQGSIADFLSFLEVYLNRTGQLTPLHVEMIAWEQAKDRLRRTSFSGAAAADQIREGWIYLNPTLAVESFRFIHTFLGEDGENGLASFAFYLRGNGDPAIVKLDERARWLLECARGGVDISLLGSEASSQILGPCDMSTVRKRVSGLANVVEIMRQRDLVLEGRDLLAFCEGDVALMSRN
jgi:hypothetical protein